MIGIRVNQNLYQTPSLNWDGFSIGRTSHAICENGLQRVSFALSGVPMRKETKKARFRR
jgi:hypothetical protein